MKKAFVLAALVSVVGVAQAQTFFASTTTYTVPGATGAVSGNGTNTAKLAISGFSIAANAVEDIAWSFKFDSTPVAAYTSVNFVIKGRFLAGGTINSLDILATEKVFDISGPVAALRADDLLDSNVTSLTAGTFSVSKSITFTQPVSLGLVQKDILLINSGNSVVEITEVLQEFQPVPEPATMAALGAGVLAMARRRRNRS